MDDPERRYDDATVLELRRLVTHAQPPSDKPLDAFGPWAEYVEPLRAAQARGVNAVRSVFYTLTQITRALGRPLSSDPDPRPTGWEMDDGGYELVVIDTLTRILGGADQMDQAVMSLMMGGLHNLTRRMGAAILIVDHHKKVSALGQRDAITDIIGSIAKAAIADVAIGMYEGSDKTKAILEICPRDWASLKMALAWDPEASAWQAVGDGGEARRTEAQAAILGAIGELGLLGELATTTNIAGHLSCPKSSVSRELATLLGSGKVVRGERRGHAVPYVVAGPGRDGAGGAAGAGVAGGDRGRGVIAIIEGRFA